MEIKVIALIGILFLLGLMSVQKTGAEVMTRLDIPNPPPVLVKPIPNQSLPSNHSLMYAFDLDDFFVDPAGYPLSYTVIDPENITISISADNKVSFFPDPGFDGIRNVTFKAISQANLSTDSNLVFLLVGMDKEPPLWYNPEKDKPLIYQSSYVNFSAYWTDNVGLKSYYLYMDGVSYPEINFSGLSNYSVYQAQISAPPSTVVFWKLCAYDTGLNLNCTEPLNFTVLNRRTPGTPSAEVRREAGGLISIISQKKAENFTIEPTTFKVNLKQGSTETRILKITNIGNTNLTFNISTIDLDGLALIGETDFMLLPGAVKEITIDFSAPLNMTPNEYFGLIEISSTSDIKFVSVVVDINPLLIDFEIHIFVPPEYKSVMPGDSIYGNISIMNLKDEIGRTVLLYYAIKDLYGNIYDSGEEQLYMNNSIFILRNLTLPGSAPEGQYIFYSRGLSNNKASIDSDSFEAGSRFFFLASLRTSFIFILIFILSFVALVLMITYSRAKEKEKILSLYLMLNELKNLIKEDKTEEAIDLYVRIKKLYGEPVSRAALQDRAALKAEIQKLSEKLKKGIVEAPQKDEKKAGVQDSKEEKKDEEKKEDAGKQEEKSPKEGKTAEPPKEMKAGEKSNLPVPARKSEPVLLSGERDKKEEGDNKESKGDEKDATK